MRKEPLRITSAPRLGSGPALTYVDAEPDLVFIKALAVSFPSSLIPYLQVMFLIAGRPAAPRFLAS